ncbi:MAG: hypothetical protein WB588_02475 [Dehalococcoidia bacterium]
MTNKNMQWWKIALCVLAVLMIAGAVTYTLMTRTSVSSAASKVPASTSNPGPSKAAASAPASTSNSAVPQTPANTPASGEASELNWVKNLNSRFATYDFIFVLFPGNADATVKADQVVKTSLEKIKQSGGDVDTMTLSSTDPEFQSTMDRLAIQKLPAVLVIAATGQGAIVKGDITETKLLQAYVSLQKTCVPGSGCCGQ